jgi:hypothetical protein
VENPRSVRGAQPGLARSGGFGNSISGLKGTGRLMGSHSGAWGKCTGYGCGIRRGPKSMAEPLDVNVCTNVEALCHSRCRAT